MVGKAFVRLGAGYHRTAPGTGGQPAIEQHLTLQNGREVTLNLSHLHDLYLEILVRFGLLGAVLFFSLPMMLLWGVGKAYTHGVVPWDYVCFIFAGWGFTAIVAFFDFQLFKFAWRNYCVIWAALTYAVYLEALQTRLNCHRA